MLIRPRLCLEGRTNLEASSGGNSKNFAAGKNGDVEVSFRFYYENERAAHLLAFAQPIEEWSAL